MADGNDGKKGQCLLYESITTLPLSKFIDCIVDGNLYALIISGTLTDQDRLQKLWENILKEYTEAIGAGEYKIYLSLYREIKILEIEYTAIARVVEMLRSIQKFITLNNYQVDPGIVDGQKKLCEELNKLLRTDCKFNYKDDTGYQEELNKCIRRSKALKIKLDLKLLAFAEIQKKNEHGLKMDRAYFDSILITISDHAKYEIGENITVSKFCERIKRYNQYCETLKNKNNVGRIN